MAKHAIVYRVEHKADGRGPWHHCGQGWGGFQRYDGHNPGDLPTPSKDGIGVPLSIEYCGVASVSKLKRWFTDPHLEDLERGGFVVRRYRVAQHRVRRGRNQVLFVKGEAEKVGEYRPTRYVK